MKQLIHSYLFNKMVLSCLLFTLYFCSCQHSFAAAFDLNNSDVLQYATESVLPADYEEDGQLVIANGSDTLNLIFKAGFGLSNDFRYARLDVINGAFNSSFVASGFATSGTFDSFLVSGGSIGDSYLVVEVSAGSAAGPDTLFTLESNSFLWNNTSEPLEIKYTLYDTADAAVNGLSFLYQKKVKLAKMIKAAGEDYVHSFEHSVGFSQSFLRFNPSFRSPNTFQLGDSTESLASTGKVLFDQLIVDDVLLPSTSVAITDYRQLIPTNDTANDNVRISGDFSSVRAFLNADDNCAGAEIDLIEFSSEKEVFTSIDNLVTHPVFCLEVTSNNIKVKRADYFIDLGTQLNEKLLGGIRYDGAAIDLPYLSNFQLYKQKIFLVNMAGYPVKYLTLFTAETAVQNQYTPGMLAEGEIPADSTLKISVSDLVSISGLTQRISARILLDAAPNDIAAAVQTVAVGSSSPPNTNVLKIQKN